MQDPSYGVPTHLLPHVHLVSDFRFPVLHNLSQEQIVEYLSHAPRIVKDQQPMTWQYFSNPPPDGTVLLVWQPERQGGLHFASDGYTYSDPEQRHQLEVAGCTIEVYAERHGWRFRQEQSTAHSRFRYRIIDRNPAIPGHFDRNLWLVHYTSLPPQQRMPVVNFRPNPQQMKELQDRAMLEQSGQLARRPFMLHDSANWPQVQFSPLQRNPMQGYPGMQMGGMRPGQPGFGGQQPGAAPGLVGQPPAKRMRTSTGGQQGMPGAMQPPMGAVQADLWVEDEEHVAMGDVIDHMTPRDISIVRYTQHHEWMEEIFGSPYAAHQIIPIDLGLGLSGELADLTRDILDAPDEKAFLSDKREQPAEYKKLVAEKKKEIEQRMDAFEKRQQEELERLKQEHAQVLARLKKSKTYMKAERQLKDGLNSAAEGGPDVVDDIVKHVEGTLGVEIEPRQTFVCVARGGLIEEEPKPAPPPPAPTATNGTIENGADVNGTMNGNDSSLEHLGGMSSFNTPGGNIPTPAANATSSAGTPGMAGGMQPESEFTLEGIDEHGAADDGMDLLDNMDIDLPDISGPMDDDTANQDGPADGGAGPDEWVMVDEGADGHDAPKPAASESSAAAPATSAPPAPASTAQATLDEAATQPATAAPPVGEAAIPADSSDQRAAAAGATPGDDLFDENADFNDFANLEDAAGDALAEFGGDDGDLGDLDLDQSAFDDLGGDADGAGVDADAPSQGPAAEAVAAGAAAEPALEVGKGDAPVTVGGEGEDLAMPSGEQDKAEEPAPAA